MAGIDVGRKILDHKANLYYAIVDYTGYPYEMINGSWATVTSRGEFTKALDGDWLGADFVKNK
jgi:hypothetical protein